MALHRFGPVMQVAYVVDDVRVAAQRWADAFGVGPFFIQDHVRYREQAYRGEPSSLDVSLAFAFSGELQIELIQQHNDAPSIYRDFLAAGGQGAQHLGALSADLDADTARLIERGFKIVQRGVSEVGGVQTIFFESPMGGVVELIAACDGVRGAFAAMKAAAEHWDGVAATITVEA